MSYVVSWSGGKESCHALYEAVKSGLEISRLVNFLHSESGRVSFHGTRAELIQIQAEAIGIPLFRKKVPWDNYEKEFKEAVSGLIPTGVEGMVFGDIYVDEHLKWVERVCREIGIKALEPLWGKPTGEVIKNFLGYGFKAVVVSANSKFIEAEWLGRKLDKDFIEYLIARNIDVCGENGEYHTLVTDGPIFKKRIEITGAGVTSRDGYWLLDIKDYRFSDKT